MKEEEREMQLDLLMAEIENDLILIGASALEDLL
jgi:hypothetical protein